MLGELRGEDGAALSLLRGLETLGAMKAGARATSGFRSGRKQPAHLLSVQASRSIPSLDVQVSGRRPRGTELTSDGVPATLEDKTALASRAHGTRSSRPPRPQPPCHRRPPGQHVRAGRPQQNLASTFGPAQYNPAAAPRGRGLPGRPRPGGGGTRWPRLPPRRSPGRGHAAARPQRLSGRRLFVLGLAGPALPVSPIGSERAAAVCARVRLCGGPARPAAQVGASSLPRPPRGVSAPWDSLRRSRYCTW